MNVLAFSWLFVPAQPAVRIAARAYLRGHRIDRRIRVRGSISSSGWPTGLRRSSRRVTGRLIWSAFQLRSAKGAGRRGSCPRRTDRSSAIPIGFIQGVERALRKEPALVEAWKSYSGDKRTSEGPYFSRTGDPLDFEVGSYADGYKDVRDYADGLAACADFIYCEAAWVLLDRHVHS
jgi:hypothetical protein